MSYALAAVIALAALVALAPLMFIWLVGALLADDVKEDYDNGADDRDLPPAA